jgi:myo-inositol-1(or 4)-monophosphatase
MNPFVLNRAFDVAQQTARLAGDHILEKLAKVDGKPKTEAKSGPNDVVTAIDQSTEALIRSTLHKEFPDFAFYGEETVTAGEQVNPDIPTWIVDPIDGTSNFEHGIPLFAVSIALVYQNNVYVGVVLELPSKRLFTAVRGEGAFCDGKKLEVRNLESMSKGIVGFAFTNKKYPWQSQAINEMTASLVEQGTKLRNFGSATLALCYVALGGLDGFYNLRLFDWDAAAAVLIIQEAFGLILDENFQPWQPRGEPHGLVAVGGGAANSLMNLFYESVTAAKAAH